MSNTYFLNESLLLVDVIWDELKTLILPQLILHMLQL
jgi:hypothetical protein